jgi:hypothetical protein
MGTSLFGPFAKGTQGSAGKKGTNCVIYTRVSTKEQADTNLSLDAQCKACNQYAEKYGYTVLANFGVPMEAPKLTSGRNLPPCLLSLRRAGRKFPIY